MQSIWHSLAPPFRALFQARRLTLILGSLFVLCLLTVLTAKRDPKLGLRYPPPAVIRTGTDYPAFLPEEMEAAIGHKSSNQAPLITPDAKSAYLAAGEPRIAYSAELGVVTKEFARSRALMEEILEHHRGYTARLRMVGQTTTSTLSATLKVPSSEYSATIAELKSVGKLEHDEEAADEIVQQRGDLEARLQNAQNTERRLQEQLKDRSGTVFDPASVERQLTELRSEIARLESDRHLFDNRAVFSNIRFSLREERIEPVESLSAQLRGATSGGLSDAIHLLSTILLFIANYGPTFLLWGVVLYFPARMIWRRTRGHAAHVSA